MEIPTRQGEDILQVPAAAAGARRCSHAESSPGDGGAQDLNRHFTPTLVAGQKCSVKFSLEIVA